MHYHLRRLFLLIGCSGLLGAVLLGSQSPTNLGLVSRTEVEPRPTALTEARPNERPLPLRDLPALTRNADLIVLRQVASVRENGRVAVTLDGRVTESQL